VELDRCGRQEPAKEAEGQEGSREEAPGRGGAAQVEGTGREEEGREAKTAGAQASG
jgi:hypothetical protein